MCGKNKMSILEKLEEEKIKDYTKSKTYILPLLVNHIKIPFGNVINTYIKHEDHPDKDRHLFCIFRWSSAKVDGDYEEMLMNHELCEFHVDISTEYYMMCFKIPDELAHNYNCFLKGKYSHISSNGKELITKYYGLTKDKAPYMVLYKDERLKNKMESELGVKLSSDSELSSIPDIDHETYKNSYIVMSKSPLKPMRKY
jgi:hypothetical protein